MKNRKPQNKSLIRHHFGISWKNVLDILQFIWLFKTYLYKLCTVLRLVQKNFPETFSVIVQGRHYYFNIRFVKFILTADENWILCYCLIRLSFVVKLFTYYLKVVVYFERKEIWNKLIRNSYSLIMSRPYDYTV